MTRPGSSRMCRGHTGPEGDGSCYCKPGYVGETFGTQLLKSLVDVRISGTRFNRADWVPKRIFACAVLQVRPVR